MDFSNKMWFKLFFQMFHCCGHVPDILLSIAVLDMSTCTFLPFDKLGNIIAIYIAFILPFKINSIMIIVRVKGFVIDRY